MSDDRRVLIHVGVHKTGTTTLQRLLFPRYGSVIGREATPGYRSAADHLTSAADSEYRPDDLRAILDASAQSARSVVVSDEGLCGSLWSDPGERDRTAARLHALVPDAQVLICVRSQPSWLQSMYSTFVKKGGYVSFSRFLDDQVPTKRVHLDHVRWDTLVAAYQRRFGRDRVLVLPYELLQFDPRSFLEQIAALIGPDAAALPVLDDLGTVNRSLSPGWQTALRYSNRTARRTHYNPHPLIPMDVRWRIRAVVERLDARVPLGSRGTTTSAARSRLERLLPRFEGSNAALEVCTGLSLRQYGYPLPG